ncbi:AVR9/CF-9 RAPIDLY ELICITED PROTEIN-RELATED [Salix viminalis]|uniref:AVR9/CF-9 RAPIDLY ELICITED PROTEIN-RELATED n=1 Tax=Salix viminalis TaxID=40686 RepID=A0A9Q0UG07_SALVM|nr:AVR9/CF-9 RAPIDLY ELICITED PROTEIN-RELATED [Salix viminalis]
MPKKNGNDVAREAWNILRLALLWGRKGGVFKRRLIVDHLRVARKFLKSLGQRPPRGQLHYGEHELSFDKTPIFHFKMHRPASMRFNIPCITPQFAKDNTDQQDGSVYECGDGMRRSFLFKGGDEEEYEDEYETCEEKIPVEYEYETCEEKIAVEEEGIDMRAEEFIARFRQQLRLQ